MEGGKTRRKERDIDGSPGGSGSASRTSSPTSPNRSSNAEKASARSDRAGRQDSTLGERLTAWAACFYNVVLPIPALSVMARAAGTPAQPRERLRSQRSRRLARSAADPPSTPEVGLTHRSAGKKPHLVAR
jgi:hypothetical protein